MNLSDKITSFEQWEECQVKLQSLIPNWNGIMAYSDKKVGPLSKENWWQYREFFRENVNDSFGRYKPINSNVRIHFVQSRADMHVHLSDQEGMVSFTKDAKAGMQDRQMVMKPGRFLSKFAGLDNETVKTVVGQFNYYHIPPTLLIAETPEEIVRVYENGPGSCMMSKGWTIKAGNHPCVVYATETTGVAYLTDEKNPERIVARTVIRKDTMKYIRIYGDADRLSQALAAAGYTQADNGLNGVTFPVIDHPSSGGEGAVHLMPYMDGSVTRYNFDDGEKTITMNPKGSMQADDTSGYKYASDAGSCSQCGKYIRGHTLRNVSKYPYCPSCLIKQIEADLISECYDAVNQLVAVAHGPLAVDLYKKYESTYYHIDVLQLHGLVYNGVSDAVESLEGNDNYTRCSITNDFVLKEAMLEIDNQWYSVIPEDKLDKHLNTMTGHLYKRKPQTQGAHLLTCRELFTHLAKTFTPPIQPLEVAALYPGIPEGIRLIILKSIKPETKKDTGYDILSLAA